jgi:hypothetical protein
MGINEKYINTGLPLAARRSSGSCVLGLSALYSDQSLNAPRPGAIYAGRVYLASELGHGLLPVQLLWPSEVILAPSHPSSYTFSFTARTWASPLMDRPCQTIIYGHINLAIHRLQTDGYPRRDNSGPGSDQQRLWARCGAML